MAHLPLSFDDPSGGLTNSRPILGLTGLQPSPSSVLIAITQVELPEPGWAGTRSLSERD